MVKKSEDRFKDVLLYGVVLCLAYFVFRVFQPFLVPLGWAAVFGVIFYSLNRRIEQRWGRTLAASLTTAGVTLILIVPVLLLSALFVKEGIDAARSVQASVMSGNFGVFGRVWQWIASHVAAQGGEIDLQGLVRDNASRFGESMASELGVVVRHIVVFLFELFVMLFALF